MSFTTNEARRAIVTELIDVGNFLNGAIAHLFQSPMVPSPALTLADFTAIEADFDGYAASAALTWGAVGTDPADRAWVTAQEVEWVPTGTTTPNTIYGYYVTNAAGTALLFWDNFPDPIPVTGPPSVVHAVPTFQYPEPIE